MIISLCTFTEICALLGERVRGLRLAQNLTQSELAGRAGISFGAVRKLEAGGQSTLATFVKCVQALGASSDFEHLLSPPSTSIAQMERRATAAGRKRARRAAPAKKQ